MRLSRLVLLSTGVVAFTACSSSDKITATVFPPLAGVRYINALNDTGAVDIRMIDQIDYVAFANALPFRSGTQSQPAEAKARHIRVFPTSTDPAVTSKYMLDTTITLSANANVTLILTGSARAKTVKFVVIPDNPPAAAAGQIAVRAVNSATGAIDAYVVSTTADPIAGGTPLANVTPLGMSSYVSRAAGAAAVRVTAAGSATVIASVAGPTAAASLPGELPAAGVNTAGTAFSVFYFPASVVGSQAPQTAAFLAPAAIWFVDRVPTS